MKANLNLGSATNKIGALGLIVTAFVWIFPPNALAYSLQNQDSKALVFDIKHKEDLQILYGNTAYESPKTKLAESLKQYLEDRNSPLAECSDIILAQNSWKKILSLANAESGLGKRFPASTNNLWGVGGANLWTMGDTVCDAVPSMNEFLANYPRRSEIKYKDMTIERMCGLYKQPCHKGHHWITNNTIIIGQLNKLEKEAYGPLLTEVTPQVLLAQN